MFIIGLTGGSGSGKSTVSNILRQRGALIVDCDRLAHQNMAKGGSAYADIVAAFGQAILRTDGEIDRSRLADIVFHNKEKLALLNKIAHGRVKEAANRLLEGSDCTVAVIDAPQLIEAGMQKSVNEVWYVYADKSLRLKRIMLRDGISREKALARMANETPEEEIKKYASVVINHNDDDLEKFKTYIIELIENKGLFND